MSSQKITYSQDYMGYTVATDGYGHVLAKDSKDYLGNFVWKDKQGNVLSKESKNYMGDTEPKDPNSNGQSETSIKYIGHKVQKDQYGNTLYTYEKDYLGHTLVKVRYGNKVGTSKKTIWAIQFLSPRIKSHNLVKKYPSLFCRSLCILWRPFLPDYLLFQWLQVVWQENIYCLYILCKTNKLDSL